MTERVYNFNPGPAKLPGSVLKELSKAVLEFNNSGMSILEISHRSKEYEAIQFDARERLLRVLGLNPDEYDAFFLSGGASLQFEMLPGNYLESKQKADYVNTGWWSVKAIKEARRFGIVNVVGSSENRKYSYIPKELRLSPEARYVHITTNNTIEGTEWPELPETDDVPLVADASSDILARNWDYSRFSLLYAGAQKNAGPAGVTLVVVRRSFLEEASSSEAMPKTFSYKTHAENNSLYNTPPVYAIYGVGLVLKWVEEQGGVGILEKRNQKKARLLYEALDEFPHIYDPMVTEKGDRSIVNVTFRLRDALQEKKFLEGAILRKMVGLEGHRTVGGFRASMYNAFPTEDAEVFAEYLRGFARAQLNSPKLTLREDS